MIKFSIVITTYNRLPLLKRAIESALSQTLSCEIIVADDGSSDGTEAYVQSLGDRVGYCRQPSNQGHSATINLGVKTAQGDWIKLIDDDDYLAANCIEEMARAIARCPQAVICSCQAIQVDEQGEELTRTRQTGPGEAFYISQEDIHYGMLLEQVPFGTPVQVAFQREAFLKSGGWDSSLDTNCDDIDSWIKIAQFGDAVFVNQYLSYRTIWGGAHNQRFSLQQRLDTNILMKQKIYALVNPKYQELLPTLPDIQNYLRLHWSIVALKQNQGWQAMQMALPAIFSWKAWQLLANAIATRRNPNQATIQRKVLIGGAGFSGTGS